MTTRGLNEVSFKRAVGQFPTGLTIVTGIHDGIPVGMTLQSFMSLSLEPMLIALAVAHTSTTWPMIETAGSFAVNVLAQNHGELARRFAKRGEARFAAVDFGTSSSGNPVLTDAVTWLDCQLHRTVDGGDHRIVIAEVVETVDDVTRIDVEALLYFRSQFHSTTTSPPEEGTP